MAPLPQCLMLELHALQWKASNRQHLLCVRVLCLITSYLSAALLVLCLRSISKTQCLTENARHFGHNNIFSPAFLRFNGGKFVAVLRADSFLHENNTKINNAKPLYAKQYCSKLFQSKYIIPSEMFNLACSKNLTTMCLSN